MRGFQGEPELRRGFGGCRRDHRRNHTGSSKGDHQRKKDEDRGDGESKRDVAEYEDKDDGETDCREAPDRELTAPSERRLPFLLEQQDWHGDETGRQDDLEVVGNVAIAAGNRESP